MVVQFPSCCNNILKVQVFKVNQFLGASLIDRGSWNRSEQSESCNASPIKKLPNAHKEVQRWFQALDNRTVGRITAKELQLAFETFQGRHFSDSVCKFVVRLFDLDKNGGIDVREFEQLYFYIKQWINAFNACDR